MGELGTCHSVSAFGSSMGTAILCSVGAAIMTCGWCTKERAEGRTVERVGIHSRLGISLPPVRHRGHLSRPRATVLFYWPELFPTRGAWSVTKRAGKWWCVTCAFRTAHRGNKPLPHKFLPSFFRLHRLDIFTLDAATTSIQLRGFPQATRYYNLPNLPFPRSNSVKMVSSRNLVIGTEREPRKDAGCHAAHQNQRGGLQFEARPSQGGMFL